MEYGLQVFDQDGFLQIDTNYITYAFKRKGQVEIPATGQVNYVFSITVDNAVAPIIFITGCEFFLDRVQTVGQQKIFYYFSLVRPFPQFATFYIFDSRFEPANFGLETYNENGVITFSTSTPVLRLAYAGNPPPGTETNPYLNGTNEYTYSGLPNGSYALAATSTRGGIDVQGDASGSTFIDSMSEYVSVTPNGFRARFEYDGNSILTSGNWGRWFQKGPPPLMTMISISEYSK